MRRLILVALAVTLIAAPTTGQDTGLVVGSGNFFSPIVANLERAIGFYREGLGLEVTGAPSNAADNAPLRNMFGLPDAQMRWTVARPSGVRQGVEIVEISQAGGRPLERRITDPGAVTLVSSTSDDIDAVVARLKSAGGTVISAPARGDGGGRARVTLIRDPDDHFVQLFAAGRTATPLPPRIRLTVQNLQKAIGLYRDALGLADTTEAATASDWLPTALGLTRNEAKAHVLEVPGSRLAIEFIQFAAGSRRTGRIQDPGSTRLQLQVRDLDAAIEAVVRAGGRIVSTGGKPVELPAGRGAPLRAAIVQDPDNLFLVLIQAAAPRT